jgi:hypothetical protein
MMDKIDLGNGCTVSRVEHSEQGKKTAYLVLNFLSREVCRVQVGGMSDSALRLLGNYMALAYLCGRRDGGLEMCRAVTRTVNDVVRDMPSQT